MAERERYAVRIVGRGVVTEFNGEPITERATAEQIVRSIKLMYGDTCKIERLVASLPLPSERNSARVPNQVVEQPTSEAGS